MDFTYKARAADGRIVEGVLSGSGQDDVVGQLRRQGLFPIKIEISAARAAKRAAPSSGGSSLMHWINMHRSIPLRDMVIFFRQLSAMINAGVTLGNALDILSEQTRSVRLAESIRQVRAGIDSGHSFSEGMRGRSEFSTLMVAMIAAGEEGGVLDKSIERLAIFLDKQDELRKKIVSAVTYPTAVILFALVILYILVTVVMPKFSKVFEGMNVELPAMTVAVFKFSNWMTNFWYIPAVTILLIMLIIGWMNKNKTTRPIVDSAKIRLPLVGDIVFKGIMARSNRTLSSLVESGVPILRALEMTAEVSDNAVIAKGYETMRDAARKGGSLGDTAKNIKAFPIMISHMMKVGEETGRLEEMLSKVADWFETELEEKIKQLTSILEPLLIIFVGGIVAIVALAIFTPIVTAIQEMM
ncbi:MAG: type II secretion system F family protein [Synergistaceae bacterium]|nr:type II secretion system F family protein [Synergistota bacterium]NLM71219.1 type II secretion system F family protein [Synergistaceae bacterium]